MTTYDPELMQNHPEGGAFREVFRSVQRIVTGDSKDRCAATHIYFSLEPNEVSVFHRVVSDEIWNLYEGDGLTLYLINEDGREPQQIELSATARNFCHVVPAGCWQAARPLGGKVLVGCTVAPGFEFEEFELMPPTSRFAEQVMSLGVDLLSRV